jgi:hypothetical protein
MNEHINRVFIDGSFRYSGLDKKDLAAAKADFRKNALQVLKEAGADHAVYCHIEYTEDGEIECASFYSDLPMDDTTFYDRTRGVDGYIGAVHKHR